ncbi:hypothetical protein FACS1894184_04310 [Clostridia bacterium]|nr:hypothetical protein FACS1894184_04310 [Clostridia bacterium]
MTNHMLNSSATVRLLILFVLVVLPIAITGIAFQGIGQRMLDEQMMSTMIQHLNFIMDDLDLQMRSGKEDLLRIITSAKTMKLTGMSSTLDAYARVVSIGDLETSMTTVLNQNPIIRSIDMYLVKQERTLSVPGTNGNFSQLDWDKLEKTVNKGITAGIGTIFEESHMYSVLQEPIALYKAQNTLPRTVVFIEYDTQYIRRRLSTALPNNMPNYILLSTDGEIVLTNENNALLLDSIHQWSEKSLHGMTTAWNNTDIPFQGIQSIAGYDLFIIVKDSDVMNFRSIFYVSAQDVFSNVRMFRSAMVVFILLSILAVILYGVYVYYGVHRRLQTLISAFERLEQGDIDFQIETRGRTEFAWLAQRLNQTLTKLHDSVAQTVRLQTLNDRSQLKQLQTQITPHFLYNNFYLLSSMLEMDDVEGAQRVSSMLGQYFRYIVRDGRDSVPLSEEIEHARTYAKLQQMRYGSRLDLQFADVPSNFPNPLVPRLILQPLLENAFRHALDLKASAGILSVRFADETTRLLVTIENDGVDSAHDVAARLNNQLRVRESRQEVTGIINVHDRLILSQGEGLTFYARSDDSLVVTMPILKVSEGDSTCCIM